MHTHILACCNYFFCGKQRNGNEKAWTSLTKQSIFIFIFMPMPMQRLLEVVVSIEHEAILFLFLRESLPLKSIGVSSNEDGIDAACAPSIAPLKTKTTGLYVVKYTSEHTKS